MSPNLVRNLYFSSQNSDRKTIKLKSEFPKSSVAALKMVWDFLGKLYLSDFLKNKKFNEEGESTIVKLMCCQNKVCCCFPPCSLNAENDQLGSSRILRRLHLSFFFSSHYA